MLAARYVRSIAATAIVAAFAGCGGGSRPAATASATPRPAATEPAQERLTPLVYVWRNFEFTGIPEEMTVYTNREVRYRNLLHTQSHIKTLSARLRPAQAAKLRRLL